jgi:hypothetical protein
MIPQPKQKRKAYKQGADDQHCYQRRTLLSLQHFADDRAIQRGFIGSFLVISVVVKHGLILLVVRGYIIADCGEVVKRNASPTKSCRAMRGSPFFS